jgi:hypothetical protein
MKKKEIPKEIQDLLLAVVRDCEMEDDAVRERQIRTWKRLKLTWEGFTKVWYSEVAHDWRIYNETQDQDTDQAYYDKPINVFRAYLESIIAALSIIIPPLKCFPDDADNPLDLATAKAGDKICELVYRHNDVSLLWLHALFIFVTEGMIACYSYPKSDDKYGTYEDKQYEDITEEHDVTTCSLCGSTIEDNVVDPLADAQLDGANIGGDIPQSEMMQPGMEMLQAPPMQTTGMLADQSGMMPPAEIPQDPNQGVVNQDLINQELDEFQPGNEDVELHNALINENQELCPACMEMMDPVRKREQFITTRLVGITKHPKSRICMEVYGGLSVKIPNYARTQLECPYLLFSREVNYAVAMDKYGFKDKKDLNKKIGSGNSPGGYDQYEQWGRLSPQYQGEYPTNVVTEKMCWLRPSSFNMLGDEDDIKKLKKLYPDGVKVTKVNDEFADACNESLDDCWTLSQNPMSDFLHFDPLGMLLTPIQDITDDLTSLTLQTIEHGVSLTFADPSVLNFKAFQQTEVTPGGMFPATPKSGKSLAEGFYEARTATLSAEVMPFAQSIQSMGQLVSGALPSLFGGMMQGGGETASQYSMSRAQAQQRQQNTWKMLIVWWKTIFGKVIPMYINGVKEDERDVQRDPDGNFINVFIRKAELEGKIGKVELEANENLPLTWGQRKDVIEKLFQNANPEIMKILAAPENLSLIHEALGLDDFYVPGEDDKNKAYDDIKQLLGSEPMPTGDPMMPEQSSIQFDPIFDNLEITFEIVRKWVISEAGRQAKTDNEAGYRNVLLYGSSIKQFLMQQMMQQQAMQAQAGNENGKGEDGAAPPEKPNQLDQEAPILGESNVSTIQ